VTPGTKNYTLTPMARTGGRKLLFVPLGGDTGYAVELHTRAGNDAAVCRPGVLVYKVDADVDTGRGPVKVYDSQDDSGGCTRSPNVQAELSDATFVPGETFTDTGKHVSITVKSAAKSGSYRVSVTRE
jgi:hypothetical protein